MAEPKTVIKIYLLPTDWSEEKYQSFHTGLVQAVVTGVPELEAHSEDDLITIFPRDAMEKGLGTEILVEIDIPERAGFDALHERVVAEMVGKEVRVYFPNAHIQCKVYRFNPNRGFWVWNPADKK